MNNEKFAFLTSTRFWSLVITSASAVLVDPTFATSPWYVALGKFLGLIAAGFTVIRTIDRNSDKKVEASAASVTGTIVNPEGEK